MNKNILLVFLLLILSAQSIRALETKRKASKLDTLAPVVNKPSYERCALPEIKPEVIRKAKEDPRDFVDDDQDLKKVGTDFVVEHFFSTPDTLFNFLKLVYGTIDNALADYRTKKGIDDRAVFLLFKGGNVLRMVANSLFDQISPEARRLLKKEYGHNFKRSDADFSVYIDDKKLGSHTYSKTLAEVTKLVFDQLNIIRREFKANPQKYFNFFQLRSDFSAKHLKKFFDLLPELDSVKKLDKNKKANPNWFGAKFKQFQLLNERALPSPHCSYFGGYDTREESSANETIATRLSKTPDWLVNTDNRSLSWFWGSDPSKTVKFYLVRTKVYFEYFYEKDGENKRKAVGGELIDVSIPHRDDDRLREFLDNYDKNVAEYTIVDNDEEFKLKAYSIDNLTEDLQFILLDSFERPWEGPKYEKRVYRIFLLFIAEMLGAYGIGSSEIKAFISELRESFVEPARTFYPLNNNSSEKAKQIQENIKNMAKTWEKLPLIMGFFSALSDLMADRLVKSPKDNDEEGLKNLLDFIDSNLDIAEQLGAMAPMKIDLKRLYNVNLNNLF